MDKKFKWASVFLWLLIVFLLVKLGSFPNHGTVVKEVVPTMALKIQQKYSNDYFSFSYPDDYIARSEGNSLWLVGKAVAVESIVTTSRKYTGNLDEESGIKLRRIKKIDYNERDIEVAGVKSILFEKKDLTERSIFILRNGVLTTFSMTTNFNDDKNGDKLWRIIESWNWK